jgi:outer membrane protein assembly factor BamB
MAVAVLGLSLTLVRCSQNAETAGAAGDEFVPGRPAPSLPPERVEPVAVSFGTEVWRTPLGVPTEDGFRVEGEAEQFVVPVIDSAAGGFTAFVGDVASGEITETLPLPNALGWPITVRPGENILVLTVEPSSAGDGQQVTARRADGTTEWTSAGADLGQVTGTSLIIEGAGADRVLVRAQPQSPAQRGDAPLWVLDAADGKVAWSVTPPPAPRWTDIDYDLVMYDFAADGSAASPSDTTVVRSLSDGAELATFALNHSDPRYGGLCGGIIAPTRVIACGLDAQGVGTAVLAEPSGAIIAEYEISGRPVIDSGAQVVTLPTTGGGIIAVDAETGEQLWEFTAEQVAAGQNLKIKEGRDGVLVADAGPLNVVLDALTGDVLLADTFFYLRPSAIQNGRVLSARDGSLVAFEGDGIPVGTTLDDAEQIIYIDP